MPALTTRDLAAGGSDATEPEKPITLADVLSTKVGKAAVAEIEGRRAVVQEAEDEKRAEHIATLMGKYEAAATAYEVLRDKIVQDLPGLAESAEKLHDLQVRFRYLASMLTKMGAEVRDVPLPITGQPKRKINDLIRIIGQHLTRSI